MSILSFERVFDRVGPAVLLVLGLAAAAGLAALGS